MVNQETKEMLIGFVFPPFALRGHTECCREHLLDTCNVRVGKDRIICLCMGHYEIYGVKYWA